MLGIALIIIYLLLSPKIEVRNNQDKQTDEPKQLTKMFSLTPKSRRIVMRLSGLFAKRTRSVACYQTKLLVNTRDLVKVWSLMFDS